MRFFALFAVLAALGAAPNAGSAPVGTSAPPVRGTLLSGKALAPAAIAGKVTVLNFWATWCPPCRAETPDMITAYAKLHARDVAFLGIDTTETAPIVKTFLSAKGVPYPTALAGPDVYNAFGIAYIPTTIVLDRNGIVRARWIGEIQPAQLANYIAAARAGRDAVFTSRQQSQIDASLDPAHYAFRGAPAQRTAALAAMRRAIAHAEALADRDQAVVDYERTQREEGLLRIAAGTAQRDAAKKPAARAAGMALLAEGQGALNRWSDAARTDRAALALAPDDPALVQGLEHAYYRLHDYPAMIAQAQRYTVLRPADGDGWSDLGLAYQRTRQFAAATPAYVRSLALLRAAAAKKPTQDNIADVADTSLDLADVYVSLGDVAQTRATFAQANAYGDRLKPKGEYASLKRNVKERTQEGLIAVALAGGNGKPVLSVAPWTGPDLPGSLASTLKYRLIVAAASDAPVTLHARGLPHDWVASFCADGLCSPQQVSFRTPPSGVKTYEFQLVPPAPGKRPGIVTISAAGGTTVTVPDHALTRRRTAGAGALLLALALASFGVRAADEGPARTVVTHHVVRLADGAELAYTATAGTLTLRDDRNEPAANIFYVAYTTGERTRPVTFLYNGGPGSASLWLQIGAFGPRRIVTPNTSASTPPGPRLADNDATLLTISDLVFIDPVGTGYSSATGKAADKDFWGVDEDIRAFSQFIRRWVAANDRAAGPKFLLGESYGTFRSAGLVDQLQKDGMTVNGVILLSSLLDYADDFGNPGDDNIPDAFAIPSEAAVAWYHKKVPNPPADLQTFVDAARAFASDEYLPAIMRPDPPDAQTLARLAGRLHAFIGLDADVLQRANLRVSTQRFQTELLRADGEITGRYDGRVAGKALGRNANQAAADPSYDAVAPAFSAAFTTYAAAELHWRTDRPYRALPSDVVNNWNFRRRGFLGRVLAPTVIPDLRDAMQRNPNLRVFAGSGLFDLATPFYDSEYQLAEVGTDPEVRARITQAEYPSGHMIYLSDDALRALRADLGRFYATAVTGR